MLSERIRDKLLEIVVGLAIVGTTGGVFLYRDFAVAQSKIEFMNTAQDKQSEAISQIPVIQNDVEHIRDELKRQEKQRKADKKEILEAIRAHHKQSAQCWYQTVKRHYDQAWNQLKTSQ